MLFEVTRQSSMPGGGRVRRRHASPQRGVTNILLVRVFILADDDPDLIASLRNYESPKYKAK